jgi:beta-alanine degradation protein BauB
MENTDPTVTNPEFYRTLWENDDVRVLEYRDTAQSHSGKNIGDTPTHTILVELKSSTVNSAVPLLGPKT